ncbi:hypothetical protein AVEN_120307-1 [Araneus ventricosus]|uniref:Reverse transcriptase domain-containing protein n=1 Tax=Araneus ventricosus TaxID=182803 RepID=A0A4Y2RA21_ARAVE|nr:hypothetical protein AVEN_120307-1 [Araneus ventricosus]
MHDILEVLPDGVHCFIYADDIFILVEAPTVPTVKNKIEASVSKLETWWKKWHSNIAPLKCKVINFSTRISPVNFPVCFSGECIPWSNNVRFLGILSSNLSFRLHIDQLVIKTSKKLNAIKVLASSRWGAKAVHLLRVCNACIIQALEFGAFAIDHKNFVIRTDELEFQQRVLDPGAINRLYYEYRSSLHSDVVILATDAYKNATGVAIAAVNCSFPTELQGSIPTINSVFTGEALAMVLANSNYVREFKDYILLTDSMSNLTTLKNSLFLAKIIAEALNKFQSLELVYSPTHLGITENEWEDSVARDALVSSRIYMTLYRRRMLFRRVLRSLDWLKLKNGKNLSIVTNSLG